MIVMRPLILHASSKVNAPAARRVLHFEYAAAATFDGGPASASTLTSPPPGSELQIQRLPVPLLDDETFAAEPAERQTATGERTGQVADAFAIHGNP